MASAVNGMPARRLCVSPKAGTDLVLTSGNELKLVYPQDNALPSQYENLAFDHFYLQPMDCEEAAAHTEKAINYCMNNPRWKLSLQTHNLWVRLGSRLGLETAISRDALGIDAGVPTDEAVDPLEDAGFRKIAIVSLHEKAAREAANEIEERTGASVLVVSDYAAGDATQSAASADVILFVWGAAKHAVYRAFDKVRDRLEYVQGTGSGSIVRALERRVARSAFA